MVLGNDDARPKESCRAGSPGGGTGWEGGQQSGSGTRLTPAPGPMEKGSPHSL